MAHMGIYRENGVIQGIYQVFREISPIMENRKRWKEHDMSSIFWGILRYPL